MDERNWLAQRFEEDQGHLRAVGYKMLGSLGEGSPRNCFHAPFGRQIRQAQLSCAVRIISGKVSSSTTE
jgi:hypothetical protein